MGISWKPGDNRLSMTTITIDEKEYETDDMSEDAQAQLVSLQFVTGEITRLQTKLAAMQTASIGYGAALKEVLKGED